VQPVNTQTGRPVALPGAEFHGHGSPGDLQPRDIELPVLASGKDALPGARLRTDRRLFGKQASFVAAPSLLLLHQADALELDTT
jgi:hypothetical protein